MEERQWVLILGITPRCIQLIEKIFPYAVESDVIQRFVRTGCLAVDTTASVNAEEKAAFASRWISGQVNRCFRVSY